MFRLIFKALQAHSATPSRLGPVVVAMLFSLAMWSAPQQTGTPAGSERTEAAEQSKSSDPDDKPAERVGSEICQACHEDIFTAFQKSPHQTVETDKRRGWAGSACESCHGPGSKHAESTDASQIRQPAKLAAGAADRLCLTCHQNQTTHSSRITSSHARKQVSCVSCHAVHKDGGRDLVVRKAADINRQCATCHTDVWASFQKPYRHRLPENAMSCGDCHNPHGSALARSLQTVRATESGCAKCHGDKVGPFPFEHAPVKLEGCGSCHQPHGSANPRMLNRPQVAQLCLECHASLPGASAKSTFGTVPPSFHDVRSPRFQNCTLCHQKVHGSYVDPAFTR